MTSERKCPTDARRTRCLASSVPTLADLSPAVLEQIESICHAQTYKPGETVVPDEARPNFVGCVSSGILRMQKTLPDGRQHIVGLLLSGDIFGRMFDGPLHFAIEAASESEVCHFQRDRFEQLLMEEPELERALLLNMQDELDAAREWMMVLGCHRVVERLAGFLLMLCRRWPKAGKLVERESGIVEVEIPISRTDLAHFLGTRTETLSRAVHALVSDGIIHAETPYLLQILDLDRLIELSGNEDLTDETPAPYVPDAAAGGQ